MLAQSKPVTCQGCPLELHSSRYLPDSVKAGAAVYVLGEGIDWTTSLPQSPIGLLSTHLFPLAGLSLVQASVGNVHRCSPCTLRPVLLSPKASQQAAAHCERTLGGGVGDAQVVVTVGEVAWKHTQHRKDLSVHSWRGHVGPSTYQGKRVYATLDPRDITLHANPRMTLPTKMDWAKLPQVIAGTFPKPLPPCLVLGECSLSVIEKWFGCVREIGTCIAWDTEYLFNRDDPWDANNYKLTMVSITCPEMAHGVQMLYHGGNATGQEKHAFIELFKEIVSLKKSIFHNAKAEAHSTWKTWGWPIEETLRDFEDTMLAHAARWSEFPHAMDFLESMYSPYEKIKHLSTNDPKRNWGDTCITLEIWKALEKELRQDPDSERVYREQSLKLVLPTLRRDMEGIRVNQAKVLPLLAKYNTHVEEGVAMAHSAIGWPINLNSPSQLKMWMKLQGVTLKKGKKSKSETLNKDAVAELRQSILPYDPDFERDEGVTIPYLISRIEQGADAVLEARAFVTRIDKLAGVFLRPLVVK